MSALNAMSAVVTPRSTAVYGHHLTALGPELGLRAVHENTQVRTVEYLNGHEARRALGCHVLDLIRAN
jgi:hypothetical protein